MMHRDTYFSVIKLVSETAINFLFGLMAMVSGFEFSGNLVKKNQSEKLSHSINAVLFFTSNISAY